MHAVASHVVKLVALGQTVAEEIALRWATENGIAAVKAVSTNLRALGQNVAQSDGTLLLTLSFVLSPEQKRAIEFLAANKKPFLHLWASVPQAGRLARHFLESHEIKILNVVGSSRDSGGEQIAAFSSSVFESLPRSAHA
jgi:hypothetical protein